MKKITLNSVLDESIGAAGASAGVIGGSMLMKMADGKVNPWLLPLMAFSAGYGIRLVATNSTLKDVGTGLLISGVLDVTKKALTKLNVDVLSPLNDSIPELSKSDKKNVAGFQIIPENLRGDFMPVEEVTVNSIRS